jgi:hypothetical protein
MLRNVAAPSAGLWRVARSDNALSPSPALTPAESALRTVGNRFDSAFGDYRVTYLGSSLEACFGETLARFRPEPRAVAIVADEWRDRGFMEVGSVPRSWREVRSVIHARVRPEGLVARGDAAFVDVDDVATHQVLRGALSGPLQRLGYKDLDTGVVRGPDRLVTRIVSQWIWQQVDEDEKPLYAGVRYSSRLSSSWECWGVFDRVPIVETSRAPITLDMEELATVARQFGLQIY